MEAQQDSIPLGTGLMIGFCTLAPLIDVFSKLAAQGVAVGEVTLARFVVQAALMAPMAALAGRRRRLKGQARGRGRLRGRALRLTVARAAVLILSTFCFVAAVRVMPIAEALAIVFVEPFIILALGRLVYGEQVGPRRLGAAAAGFAGALLIIQPSFSQFGAVAFFPLGTALFFALYILITRQLAPLVHPIAMQADTAVVAVILWLPVMAAGSAAGIDVLRLSLPGGSMWLWLFGVGLAASVSHMLMTIALRFAPAATLAPLHYLEMVSATSFGYLVFGNFPDALSWAGIALIAASGLYIIHRERVASRQPAPAPAASATARPEAGSPASAVPKTEAGPAAR